MVVEPRMIDDLLDRRSSPRIILHTTTDQVIGVRIHRSIETRSVRSDFTIKLSEGRVTGSQNSANDTEGPDVRVGCLIDPGLVYLWTEVSFRSRERVRR